MKQTVEQASYIASDITIQLKLFTNAINSLKIRALGI